MATIVQQLSNNTDQKIIWDATGTRFGQRLTITNANVTTLEFLLRKLGTPTGTLTFEIATIADVVLGTQLWGNAVDLPAIDTWEAVSFANPIFVNEEVRIYVKGSAAIGPNTNNCPILRTYTPNIVGGELWTEYSGGWTDNASYDAAYRYTYETGSSVPTITQQALTAITNTTATGNGVITSLGQSAVTEHGHCWNTAVNPTTANSKTTNGAGSLGAFTSAITGLTLGTRYYIRAYATNTQGTGYSGNLTFISGDQSTMRLLGNIGIKGTTLRYVGNDGVENYLQGTAV